MNYIDIYTDGGSRGNGILDKPIAGWGAVILYRNKMVELNGYVHGATNQQMELMAVVKALEKVEKHLHPINIYSDSAYIINCINQKWYKKWMRNGWKNSKKEPVANKELWESLFEQLELVKTDVKFIKVKGHAGIEGNEVADLLANMAMDELEGKINE